MRDRLQAPERQRQSGGDVVRGGAAPGPVKVLDGRAGGGGERREGARSGVRRIAVEDLLRGPPPEAGEDLEVPHAQRGDMGEDRPESVGNSVGGHGEDIRHQRQRSSSATFATTENPRRIALVKAATASYQNPIASRIVAHCAEERISLRELSRRAGLSESTAQKVCERLEGDVGDVGLATLTALAAAMGQSLTWLLYGETPPAPTALRDLDGWADAARAAAEHLGADPASVERVGAIATLEPVAITAFAVADMARHFKRT